MCQWVGSPYDFTWPLLGGWAHCFPVGDWSGRIKYCYYVVLWKGTRWQCLAFLDSPTWAYWTVTSWLILLWISVRKACQCSSEGDRIPDFCINPCLVTSLHRIVTNFVSYSAEEPYLNWEVFLPSKSELDNLEPATLCDTLNSPMHGRGDCFLTESGTPL